MQLFYGVVPVLREDDRALKLQVIKYARMFRVADPVHFLFGRDVSPVSGTRIMNLMDFETVFGKSAFTAHIYM